MARSAVIDYTSCTARQQDRQGSSAGAPGVRLMDVAAFLQGLRDDPGYADQIAHVHTEPAREAQYAELPPHLLPGVRRFLSARGVSRLYRHQREAVEILLDGGDALVTTSAASGKSLCYQIPVLHAMLSDADATALWVFPAKALARDQAQAFNAGIAALTDVQNAASLLALPFDGDSGAGDRRTARDAGRLLVTNPEMIHSRLIPAHGRWQRFFKGLRYVVLDEVHTYAGFFGANMANVLRRLERICEHYGSRPRYVCCSATIGNPEEMTGLLTNRKLQLVSDDASASGTRTFVFWNPPRIKARSWRGRRSANVEAHELMAKLLQQRTATICFSKARNTAEMIYRYVREKLTAESPGLASRVVCYRGGYSAAERRDMEDRLRTGDLLGVSATRALELGIDIGMLEACIIIGYPGTLNAFLQQAARAGRSGRDALCILVGIDTPINQYIMSHPEYVFERPIERVVIDKDNPFVVLGHVRCASAELPVNRADIDRFGYATPLTLEVLEENRKVHRGGEQWYHIANEAPAFEVRLRGYGDESTVIQDIQTGQQIDRMDTFRAMRLFYEGAIYFHRGDTYAMVDHDTERNLVRVRRVDVEYYTDPVTGTAVDHIDGVLDRRALGTAEACLGEVYAILETPLYERVRFYTLDRISQHPTGLPNIAYEAMSFWLIPPEQLMSDVLRLGLEPSAGMLGILYCVSRILPLFLTSDQNDFDWSQGARNAPWQAMFWYEFYLHGIGNAEQCYERLEEILTVALEHVLTCDCEDGCPNCVSRLITPYHVRNIELGEGNRPVSRRAAVVILNSILNGASAEDSFALLSAPRDKRGQKFLPALTTQYAQHSPHHMPLNERTRSLLLRKLERSRSLKQALDHAIAMIPPEAPPSESKETLDASDSEMRSGSPAIKRTTHDLRKKLRTKLDAAVARHTTAADAPPHVRPAPAPSTPQAASAPPTADAPQESTAPPPADAAAPVPAGDSVARRARELKKRRKKEG
jgi:DEAD/DEAH box helicase domain-containing protein